MQLAEDILLWNIATLVFFLLLMQRPVIQTQTALLVYCLSTACHNLFHVSAKSDSITPGVLSLLVGCYGYCFLDGVVCWWWTVWVCSWSRGAWVSVLLCEAQRHEGLTFKSNHSASAIRRLNVCTGGFKVWHPLNNAVWEDRDWTVHSSVSACVWGSGGGPLYACCILRVIVVLPFLHERERVEDVTGLCVHVYRWRMHMCCSMSAPLAEETLC